MGGGSHACSTDEGGVSTRTNSMDKIIDIVTTLGPARVLIAVVLFVAGATAVYYFAV